MENRIKPAEISAQRAALSARFLNARENETEQAPRISPRKDSASYPLSPGQRRMWILDQFEKKIHYNENLSLRLKGTISVPVLKSVLQEILRRHEAMRSCFELVGDQLVQRITPVEAMELPVIDLRALPQSSRESGSHAAGRGGGAQAVQFIHRTALAIRLVIDRRTRLTASDHSPSRRGRWLVMGRLSKRILAALYKAFRARKPSPLPELAIQYADYAVWQREWLESERRPANNGPIGWSA